jgi:hypothetical protein
MSKTFRDWSLDQALLLPPSVHDFVPAGHLSRFVVALVTEELDLSAILASYQGEKGQPPYHPAMMVALLMRSASTPRGGSPRRAWSGSTSCRSWRGQQQKLVRIVRAEDSVGLKCRRRYALASPASVSVDAEHSQLFQKTFCRTSRYQCQQYRTSANCFATPQPLPVSTTGDFLCPVLSGA